MRKYYIEIDIDINYRYLVAMAKTFFSAGIALMYPYFTPFVYMDVVFVLCYCYLIQVLFIR